MQTLSRVFMLFVVAVVTVLLAAACATDTDPELTLLPADSTITPTIPDSEIGTDPDGTDPDGTDLDGTDLDGTDLDGTDLDGNDNTENDVDVTPATSSTTTSAPALIPTTLPPRRSGNPLRAETAAGDVLGERSNGVVTFRAVPYAASPTGQLRFAGPAPAVPFVKDFDATRPGVGCPQNGTAVSIQLFPVLSTDENCLTLDVFTPATGDALPVMVWFHDGDFESGSAHSEAYDGSNLAMRDVVVINVNYRLDALGFLVTEEMAKNAGSDAFANRGFQDQIAALEWVQRNVSDFGGDPANVTIFGHGAGAKSVCGHLASPKSEGLFHKAIMQSGGACDSILTIEEAIERGEAWLAETNCAEAEFVEGCIQFLELDDILDASAAARVGFDLVVDGVFLDRSAFSLASTNELGDIPLLIGSTLDEGTLFTVGLEEPTDQELRDLVLVELESNTDLLLSQYESLETNLEKQAVFIADSQYACAADRLASAAGDETNVYTYQMIHRSVDAPLSLGATHGSDVILLFGNPAAAVGYTVDELNADDLVVANFMATAWTTFAANGIPEGGSDWPPYLDSSPAHLLIGFENTVSGTLQDGRCEILSATQQ